MLKLAIASAVEAGVPEQTIVLLLLLPLIALVIAFARNVIGLRGFGIFLPASLAVVFTAIGPVLGLGLFVLIITISTLTRLVLRKTKIKLQYLPRMSLILLLVVVGVLGVIFLGIKVSVFPVLILVLLAEDVTRVQLGKSAQTAINLTSETLVLALLSYLFLTFQPLQELAFNRPGTLLLTVFVLNLFLAKYSGLRLMEIVRFKQLLKA